MIDPAACEAVLEALRDLGLLDEPARTRARAVLQPDWAFASAVSLADSMHLHVKVPAVEELPRAELERLSGGTVENERPGYVKFPTASGLNMIFSSIPTSMEDLLPERARIHAARLDHIGLDLRQERPDVRAAFDGAPAAARASGWRHAAQGSDDRAVHCCHFTVARKHWIFPPESAAPGCPVELAYGPLRVHGAVAGCDLRPLDPDEARERGAPAVGLPRLERLTLDLREGALTIGQVEEALSRPGARGVRELVVLPPSPAGDALELVAALLERYPVELRLSGAEAARVPPGRLAALGGRYSLEVVVRLESVPPASEADAASLSALCAAGLVPVVEVPLSEAVAPRAQMLASLRALGVARPRLRLAPGAAGDPEQLIGVVLDPPHEAKLECGRGRSLSARGVSACRFRAGDPAAADRAALDGRAQPIRLGHPACVACHREASTCAL